MRKGIKIFKITGVLLLVAFIILMVVFYRFSEPKSDAKIKKEFEKQNKEVTINYHQYLNFQYRVLATQKEIDTTLPTIVFIHGSIGSAFDFKSYLMDADLNEKANLMAYDRVGYGVNNAGDVQESIAFEVALLEDLTKELLIKNTILIGYSYGGPIALASKRPYKKIILLAPAVYSKEEPMPWALNFYKWKATRWVMPKTWKAASKEKISHKKDLQSFENEWATSLSHVLSIHGKEDWIVPFENSLYLKDRLLENQFELVTLNNAGHGLVWTHFDKIKQHILQQLN